MSKTTHSMASAAADGLAAVLRAVGPLGRAWMRVYRLASLRARVEGPVPVTTQFDGAVRTAGRPRLELGEHCRLGAGVFFETNEGGRISLGGRVRVNAGTVLVSYAGVTIGDECLIGEYVSIRDADHGSDVGAPMRSQPHRSAPIRIGRDVWIARGAVILKGVTVGDGAIVAANSVVTRDVPSMAVVGGVPARVLKYRGGQEVPAEFELEPARG